MAQNQNFLGSLAPSFPGGGLGAFGGVPGVPGFGFGGGGGGGGGGIADWAKYVPEGVPGAHTLLSLFGGKKGPKVPLAEKLFRKEYAQGSAALRTQDALYEPTLAFAQKSASDYGDLYRRAANEALSHNITSASATRGADLADYERLSPMYYEAVRNANPQATGVRDNLFEILQRDAASIDDPMSSAAAREVTQGSYGQSAQHGFGPSARQAAMAYISQGLTGEQLSAARRSQLFQASLQFLGANQSAMGDAFQAITGRPSMPSPQGVNIMGQTAGTPLEDLFSYGVNYEIQQANKKQAERASNMALIGQLGGAVIGAGGMAAGLCWVAREVFGEERDPVTGTRMWKLFRHWLLNSAPQWFVLVYLKCGPDYAKTLREHPEHKPPVRAWMLDRIHERN